MIQQWADSIIVLAGPAKTGVITVLSYGKVKWDDSPFFV